MHKSESGFQAGTHQGAFGTCKCVFACKRVCTLYTLQSHHDMSVINVKVAQCILEKQFCLHTTYHARGDFSLAAQQPINCAVNCRKRLAPLHHK